MADIFEIAKVYGYEDYYDFNTGYTYLIKELAASKRLDLPFPAPGIRAKDSYGNMVGYVQTLTSIIKKVSKYDNINNYWSDFSYWINCNTHFMR